MTTPETTNPPQAAKPQSKLVQYATMGVAAILMVIGFMQVYNAFVPSLPSCSSSTTRDTIAKIFKEKNLELSDLTNQKTITDAKDAKTCSADFLTPAETGSLEYRISWQGKDAQVLITKADSRPR